jgi:hypothetical protein
LQVNEGQLAICLEVTAERDEDDEKKSKAVLSGADNDD